MRSRSTHAQARRGALLASRGFGVLGGARCVPERLMLIGVLQAVAHLTPSGKLQLRLGVVDEVAELVDGDVGEFLAAGV